MGGFAVLVELGNVLLFPTRKDRVQLQFAAACQFFFGSEPVSPGGPAPTAPRFPIGVREIGNCCLSRGTHLIVRGHCFGRLNPWLVIQKLGGIHRATSVRHPKAGPLSSTVRSSTEMHHGVLKLT